MEFNLGVARTKCWQPVVVVASSRLACERICRLFMYNLCHGVYGCTGVYGVCCECVCLLAGARAHFEVPQHFLADTFYTRRAQHKICDSSFSGARLALIEFRLARLIVHFAEGRKKTESNKDTAFLLWFICLNEKCCKKCCLLMSDHTRSHHTRNQSTTIHTAKDDDNETTTTMATMTMTDDKARASVPFECTICTKLNSSRSKPPKHTRSCPKCQMAN